MMDAFAMTILYQTLYGPHLRNGWQGSHGVGKSWKGMEFNFDSSRPGNGLEFHVVVGKCG